jgi:hypothetical protein
MTIAKAIVMIRFRWRPPDGFQTIAATAAGSEQLLLNSFESVAMALCHRHWWRVRSAGS